jgi:stage III sporulation protein AD
MSIAAICFVGIITAVISVSLRKYNTEVSFLVTLAGSIIIFLSVILNISSLFETVKHIFDTASIQAGYIKILFKAVGLCFICEFAVDLCVDCCQRSLANNISIAGKVLVLITAIPLYKDILSTILSLTGAGV